MIARRGKKAMALQWDRQRKLLTKHSCVLNARAVDFVFGRPPPMYLRLPETQTVDSYSYHKKPSKEPH
jgi:hypothetical protein